MPYIDSEALKKKIFPYGMADNGNYGINAKSVMVAIEDAPAVDAVEVVRCGECKHFHEYPVVGTNDPSGWGKCTKIGMDIDLTINDFCSYGERRR